MPLQIINELEEAATVGVVTTLTIMVRLDTQPATLVPLTVYVVVTPGVTVTADPVNPPGFQVQVDAPDALKATVAPLPEQIDVGVAVALIVGVGFTNKVTVLVFVQPPFDPVTE